MKNIKALVTIIGILIVVALGYFLYSSMEKIDTEPTDYDFTTAEPLISDEFDEINSLNDSSMELEVEFDTLSDLGFEEPITEENFESTIEADANAESDMDSELDELEDLDF